MAKVVWSESGPDKKTSKLIGKTCLVCTTTGGYDVAIFAEVGAGRGWHGQVRFFPAEEITHFALIESPSCKR